MHLPFNAGCCASGFAGGALLLLAAAAAGVVSWHSTEDVFDSVHTAMLRPEPAVQRQSERPVFPDRCRHDVPWPELPALTSRYFRKHVYLDTATLPLYGLRYQA